jgi:hypothetical protein
MIISRAHIKFLHDVIPNLIGNPVNKLSYEDQIPAFAGMTTDKSFSNKTAYYKDRMELT